jgi:GNAT superfamily N-acetyltransferase
MQSVQPAEVRHTAFSGCLRPYRGPSRRPGLLSPVGATPGPQGQRRAAPNTHADSGFNGRSDNAADPVSGATGERPRVGQDPPPGPTANGSDATSSRDTQPTTTSARGLHRGAQCFAALWGGVSVAFSSYLHLPGKDRRLKREYRTVVLPDYQGAGIGNAVSEWLGAYLKAGGWRFVSTTSHPAMIRHRARSAKWRLTSSAGHKSGHRGATKSCGQMPRFSSTGRITASFEYVGPALEPQRTREG